MSADLCTRVQVYLIHFYGIGRVDPLNLYQPGQVLAGFQRIAELYRYPLVRRLLYPYCRHFERFERGYDGSSGAPFLQAKRFLVPGNYQLTILVTTLQSVNGKQVGFPVPFMRPANVYLGAIVAGCEGRLNLFRFCHISRQYTTLHLLYVPIAGRGIHDGFYLYLYVLRCDVYRKSE